jgi:hypothetical protein
MDDHDIRPEVADFVRLGPLPPELAESTTEELVQRFQDALFRIARPVSEGEAIALARSFGHDNCFGLAWTLLHLIETGPRSALDQIPTTGNEWVERLHASAARAALRDAGSTGER